MKTASTVQENAEDILAEAKQINEERAKKEEEVFEDEACCCESETETTEAEEVAGQGAADRTT